MNVNGIDGPVAVRAASTGFTVLLLGGLAAPIAAQVLGEVGRYWLLIVAVVAFITAGVRIGSASSPMQHGAVAAIGGYLLVLPIVFVTGGLEITQVGTTLAAAVVVGGLSGYLRGRYAGRPPFGGAGQPSGGDRRSSRPERPWSSR